MAFPFLKSIHYVSMYAFLGLPLFWHLFWRPALGEGTPEEGPDVYKNVGFGVLLGAMLFAVSGLADGLAAGDLGLPATLNIVLAGTAAAAWHGAADGRRGRLWTWIAVGAGGALLVVVSWASRAGAEPGMLPWVSHVVHLGASMFWVGGLFLLAVLPWNYYAGAGSDGMEPLAAFIEGFNRRAFAAVGLVAATGAFAAALHVSAPVALQQTTYGRTLAAKIGLFAVAFVVGAVNFLFVPTALRRAGRTEDEGLRRRRTGCVAKVVRIQAVVFVAVLVVTGMLTSLQPGDGLDELMEGRRELDLGLYRLTVDTSRGDVPGEVRFDIALADAAGAPPPAGVAVVFDLEMPDHMMGLHPIEAEPLGAGRFVARALPSMEGRWQVHISARFPGGDTAGASFSLDALEAARSAGQTRRLDPRAVFFDFVDARRDAREAGGEGGGVGGFLMDFLFSPDGRPVNFVAGAFWLAAALYVVVSGLRGGLPRWTAPVGMLFVFLGGYLLFSSMWVDAYPTAFVRNPVPFDAASVAQGRELYTAHCSVCHGPEGHGDGELAPFLTPPPEDLRVRHVDAHPDGELFWWFLHGLPGTEMPSTEATMTDTERWHVVNFVRSLHREVPR